MVQVEYEIGKERLKEEVIEPNFLLANNNGGYFLDYKSTKYRGLFIAEKSKEGWTLTKSIDKISINNVPTEFASRLWGVEKRYIKSVEKFFLHQNTLLYEVGNYDGMSLMTLDFRDINDFDVNGKKYLITEEEGFILVKFAKGDFTRFLAIKTNASYSKPNKWSEEQFEFDRKRNDAHGSWYVYEGLLFSILGNATFAISFSHDKEKAKNEANYVYFSHPHLKMQKDKQTNALFGKEIPDDNLKFAYECSLKSLDDLVVSISEMQGIYAGLPWFFQWWARDEAISLGAFIKEEKFDFAKKIILKQTSKILDDGRVPNRSPFSDLGSADGVGWIFTRFAELFTTLRDRRKLLEVFKESELYAIRSRLKDSLEKLANHYIQQNLTLNRRKETWMDTDFGNDPRDGARIEIQALTLSMIKAAKELCKYLHDPDYRKYEKLESEMKAQVRKVFYRNGELYDGHNDPTVRPNVFLAHYIYPELLHRKEWRVVFEKALGALWLEWGGLCTIDRKSPLYCDEYTGMDNRSYHRGDSWYWINNLAAICMHRIDSDYFSEQIRKILNSSTKEILRMGTLGCHAELSSAKEQRSEGTTSQAWSSAMYIELIHEIFFTK